MGLILLTCSWFLSVSVSHVIVCLSIDTPLYWFGLDLIFTTAFSNIRVFLAESRVHTRIVGQKSCTYAAVLYTVSYILPFGWVWCCGKLLGGLWVWLCLPSVWCCLLDASFVTRDRFFIDFSLKVVLVIYPFCFVISALLFFVSVSCSRGLHLVNISHSTCDRGILKNTLNF